MCKFCFRTLYSVQQAGKKYSRANFLCRIFSNLTTCYVILWAWGHKFWELGFVLTVGKVLVSVKFHGNINIFKYDSTTFPKKYGALHVKELFWKHNFSTKLQKWSISCNFHDITWKYKCVTVRYVKVLPKIEGFLKTAWKKA